MLTLGACASDEGTIDESFSPGQSPSATAASYTLMGPGEQIGTGFVVATTRDGSAVYVSDPDPAFPQPGCEGQPESVLSRLPVDGGKRELLRSGDQPLKDMIVRGPNGKVALIDLCEGFFQALQIGQESDDGKITDLKEVTPDLNPEEDLLAAFSFSWSNDGEQLLAAINDPEFPDGELSRLVSINPLTGTVTELFQGEGGSGVFQFAQLEDGTYVLSSNRVVTLRDDSGQITSSFKGNGFVVAPDNTGVVIYGEALSTATQGDSQAAELVPHRPGYEISSASISPDGNAVLFNRYQLNGDDRELGILTLADGKLTSPLLAENLEGSAARASEAEFTGDNSGIVYHTISDEGTGLVFFARFEP